MESIEVPVAKVTSCAFGGESLHTLYITTSSLDVDEQEWKNQPHAGGIFAIELDVMGIAEKRFDMKF